MNGRGRDRAGGSADRDAGNAHPGSQTTRRLGGHVIQQQLFSEFMLGGHENHGIQVIRTRPEVGRSTPVRLIGLGIVPACEQARDPDNRRLGVGGGETGIGAEHEPPIIPLPIDSDGEQLHDLAAIVLVRMTAERIIALLVGTHVEIEPHRRGERDRLENPAEGAAVRKPGGRQAVVHQLVIIVGENAAISLQRTCIIGPGNHHDLTEGKGQTLAQLVRTGDGVLPPCVSEER